MQAFLRTILALLCSNLLPLDGQQLKRIMEGEEIDSSYYHAMPLSENEIWLAGEYGILTSIDSLGRMKPISYPNLGYNILHMVQYGSSIYLSTENGVIYRYHMDTKQWETHRFKRFKRRAFYEMELLENGEIVICGGGRRVSRGGAGMPRGFIARTDTGLTQMRTEWRSPFKFVWDIENTNDSVLAVAYNGFSSRMWISSHKGQWKKQEKSSMLVHDLHETDSGLWICGMRNIQLHKNGRAQYENHTTMHIPVSGALWSMYSTADGSLIALSHSGSIEVLQKGSLELQTSNLRVGRPLYTLAWFNENSAVVAGHAHSIYLLHWP
jgi:hypothetical protein